MFATLKENELTTDVYMTFNDDIAAAVDAGIERLDVVSKAWRDRIVLEDLTMVSVDNCLLTQAFGGYKAGLDFLGIDRGEAFGFDIPDTIYDVDVQEEVYEMLTSEWVGRLIG